MLDHDVALAPSDLTIARRVFADRSSVELTELDQALGGLGKCLALHVRRLISIDLRHDLRRETPVKRMPDDRAIFEMSGATPW